MGNKKAKDTNLKDEGDDCQTTSPADKSDESKRTKDTGSKDGGDDSKSTSPVAKDDESKKAKDAGLKDEGDDGQTTSPVAKDDESKKAKDTGSKDEGDTRKTASLVAKGDESIKAKDANVKDVGIVCPGPNDLAKDEESQKAKDAGLKDGADGGLKDGGDGGLKDGGDGGLRDGSDGGLRDGSDGGLKVGGDGSQTASLAAKGDESKKGAGDIQAATCQVASARCLKKIEDVGKYAQFVKVEPGQASALNQKPCDPEEMKKKFTPSRRIEVAQLPTAMKRLCTEQKEYDPLAKPEEPEAKESKMMKMLGLGKRHMEMGKAWSWSLGLWSGLFWTTLAYVLVNHYPVNGCKRVLPEEDNK